VAPSSEENACAFKRDFSDQYPAPAADDPGRQRRDGHGDATAARLAELMAILRQACRPGPAPPADTRLAAATDRPARGPARVAAVPSTRRCACGGGCPRCSGSGSRPGLDIAASTSPSERSARRLADAVSSAPAGSATTHPAAASIAPREIARADYRQRPANRQRRPVDAGPSARRDDARVLRAALRPRPSVRFRVHTDAARGRVRRGPSRRTPMQSGTTWSLLPGSSRRTARRAGGCWRTRSPTSRKARPGRSIVGRGRGLLAHRAIRQPEPAAAPIEVPPEVSPEAAGAASDTAQQSTTPWREVGAVRWRTKRSP
jgi:hypothetical protein